MTPPAADFFIDLLPGQPNNTVHTLSQFSGHLPSHPSSAISPPPDSHLWFWFIRASHLANRQKLVIWFNGGPGCSSLEGALMEIGPLRVKETPPGQPIELESSDFAWSQYANLLFSQYQKLIRCPLAPSSAQVLLTVDQPAGTGYSFVNNGDDVRELAQAADQIVVFLANFYKTFPELSAVDTYLAGESFAGQYIPYIAQAILDTTTLPTPLKGILMGNAWINPQIQYPAYLDFAYKKGLLVKDSAAAKFAETVYEPCKKVLDSKERANHILISECEEILAPILQGGAKTVSGVRMTPISYNITQLSESGDASWPPVVASLTRYLDQSETAHAFHADAKGGIWAQCNVTISRETFPHSVPSYTLLPGLLSKMPVLLYAGDQDFMCNALGISRSIDALSWAGQKGFGRDSNGAQVNASEYIVQGERVGTWTEARGLTFVVIDKASHLVPIDAPLATLDMLLRFMELDPLSAAGPSASTSSSVDGNATQFLLAKTFMNGSLVAPALASSVKDSSSSPGPLTSGSGSPAVDRDREAFYGPRRTVTLVLMLVAVIGGLTALLRWRRTRRTRKTANLHRDPEPGALAASVTLKNFEVLEGGTLLGRGHRREVAGPVDPEGERLLDDAREGRDRTRLMEEELVFGIGSDDHEDV